MAYVILTSTTKQRHKATLYANGTGKLKAIDHTASKESEREAARRLVIRFHGHDIAEGLRLVLDKEELKTITCGHFDSPMRKQVFQTWTFKQ